MIREILYEGAQLSGWHRGHDPKPQERMLEGNMDFGKLHLSTSVAITDSGVNETFC